VQEQIEQLTRAKALAEQQLIDAQNKLTYIDEELARVVSVSDEKEAELEASMRGT
jgi:hypothetical protein